MPQAQFLDFLTTQASRYPSFELVMCANVRELIEQDHLDGGVRAIRASRRVLNARLYDLGFWAVDEQGLPVAQRAVGDPLGAIPGNDPLDGSRLRMPR